VRRIAVTCAAQGRGRSEEDRLGVGFRLDARAKAVGGYDVHRRMKDCREFPLEGPEGYQARIGCQVDHEVDIAVTGVLAASDTSEHADVRGSVALGHLEHGRPMTA